MFLVMLTKQVYIGHFIRICGIVRTKWLQIVNVKLKSSRQNTARIYAECSKKRIVIPHWHTNKK